MGYCPPPYLLRGHRDLHLLGDLRGGLLRLLQALDERHVVQDGRRVGRGELREQVVLQLRERHLVLVLLAHQLLLLLLQLRLLHVHDHGQDLVLQPLGRDDEVDDRALRRDLGPVVRVGQLGLDVELELPRKCRDIFNEYDTDGSGYIDLGELEMALHSLGVECDSETVANMIDEAGIDQGEGDHVGIDFPSWLELLKSMYTGSDESIWEVAKAGIVKMIGSNLNDDELYARTDAVFKELDTGGSGELDMGELSVAMKNIGVNVLDDELSRMLEECDVNGRLWTVTASNHLGECKYLLKIIVVEGASELGYASTDVFCGIRQKSAPLKVAHLRGARPFKYSILPMLPEGLEIDEETGLYNFFYPLLHAASNIYKVDCRHLRLIQARFL